VSRSGVHGLTISKGYRSKGTRIQDDAARRFPFYCLLTPASPTAYHLANRSPVDCCTLRGSPRLSSFWPFERKPSFGGTPPDSWPQKEEPVSRARDARPGGQWLEICRSSPMTVNPRPMVGISSAHVIAAARVK
jgi:hypothetical protein